MDEEKKEDIDEEEQGKLAKQELIGEKRRICTIWEIQQMWDAFCKYFSQDQEISLFTLFQFFTGQMCHHSIARQYRQQLRIGIPRGGT